MSKRFVSASTKRARSAYHKSSLLPSPSPLSSPPPLSSGPAAAARADVEGLTEPALLAEPVAARLASCSGLVAPAPPVALAAQGRPAVLRTPGPKTSNAASLAFIHPNLYLTSLSGAKCFEGPVAIVAAGGRETTDYLRNHRAEYRAYVNVDDTPFMTFVEFVGAFSKSADLLKKALDTGHTTLLHCHQGINRSVATALAYVIRHTTLDYDACLRQIRKANAAHRALPALINPAFQTYLRCLAMRSEWP